MNAFPVDNAWHLVLVGVAPHMREGVIVTNRDGIPISNVSCLVPPSEEGGKAETIEVRVPAPGVPKDLPLYTPIRFNRLIARLWSIDGRSGLAFAAESVRATTAAKAAA